MRSRALLLVFAVACTPRREEPVVHTTSAEAPLCGGCHEDAAGSWRQSMHHASFTNEDFQAAFHDEPLAFCANCHAPHGKERGVDCASCHRPGTEHTTRADDSVCKGCHEFSTPKRPALLQSTFSEHGSDTGCIDCHMKRDGAHRDHRFTVSRDPGFLGRAIALSDLERTRDGVTVSIAKQGVGHRFPTGDVFRALFVRAWVETDDGRIASVAEASLHRDWDAFRSREPETNDTRLGEEPAKLTLALPPTIEGGRVRIQVDYQRGATARAGALALFSSLRIADWTRPLPRVK